MRPLIARALAILRGLLSLQVSHHVTKIKICPIATVISLIVILVIGTKLLFGAQEGAPVLMELHSSSGTVKSGSMATLHARTINRSAGPVKLVRVLGLNNAVGQFATVSFRRDGVRDFVDYNEMIRKSNPLLNNTTNVVVVLSPGEALDEDFELQASYDLRRPGRYSVVVSRDIFIDEKRVRILSNTEKLTVR